MWRYDRSWMENFLSSWATLLLAAMAVTSLALRYVSDPIICMFGFPQANQYFTERCFQETSIVMRSHEFVEFSQQIWLSRRWGPEVSNVANPFKQWPKQRTYHQWVPFALGTGALLCLVPHVAWRLLNALLWLDCHALMTSLKEAGRSNSRSSTPVHERDSALVVQAGLKGGNNWLLTAAALGRKVLACSLCLLQVVLIAVLFNPPLGGGEAGDSVKERGELSFTRNVTAPDSLGDVPLPVEPFFCTVEFTQDMNSQSLTMQCVLPLNKVYAKAFVFLFYFFLLLMALCVMDVLYWLGRLFLPSVRDLTLVRNLSIICQSHTAGSATSTTSSVPSQTVSTQLYDFAQILGLDGRLLLALVTDHCGPVSSLHFTDQLWLAFQAHSSACIGPASMSLGPDPVGGGVVEEMGETEPDPSNTADDSPLELVEVVPQKGLTNIM